MWAALLGLSVGAAIVLALIYIFACLAGRGDGRYD